MSTEQLDNDLEVADGIISTVQNDLIRMDSLNYNERTRLDTSIEQQLSRLEQLLTKMNNSLKNIPATERDYYVDEITKNRATYSHMLSELRQKRQAMLSDPGYKQNQQLNQNLDTTNRIMNNMDEALAYGNDALNAANHTQNVLNEDRKLIENIDSNLSTIDVEAETGFTRAKRMLCRAVMNNILIWTVVVLLVALLGFSLYWKLRKQYDLSATIVSAEGFSLSDATFTLKFGKSVGPKANTETFVFTKVTGKKELKVEANTDVGKLTGSYKTSKLALNIVQSVNVPLSNAGTSITVSLEMKKH